MENELGKLVDFYDLVVWDSLKAFMQDKKAKNEYIQKIKDLDELLEYAELRELYEVCGVLLDMKKQIIENNKK